MLGGTDIYKVDTGEADPAVNVRVIRPYNKRQYDTLLKVEATKRVLWKKCLNFCDLDRSEVKYFNKAFYTDKEEEGKCAFTCFNDRVIAHLGEDTAKEYDLLYNWDKMRAEYDKLRAINPNTKLELMLEKTKTEEEQQRMFEKLERQGKMFKSNRFDFY
ncbi:unnamed protein product [Moneuplotes crassus]|uniref:Uncharacterized protein n=1 Tax=Euplotes crassus TaxID=5936 RepID=A0AAD1XX10_EUPCR|nr:unnamed protein product [Moneuplotes crassus]